MISVPSRLQLSSGNNLLLVICLVATLLSCGSISKTSRAGKGPSKEAPAKDAPVEEKKNKTASKYKYINTSFDISFVLPVNSGDNALISYYEGAKMALDSLEKIGLKANVRFYDAKKNDSLTIAGILASESFSGSDIVIGPIVKNAFRLASEWSEQKRIPVISPFSNAYLESDENPYSIYFTPSIRAYAKGVHKLASTLGKEVNVVVVDDGTAESKQLYKEINKILVSNASVSFTLQPEVDIKDVANVQDRISKTKPNLVVGWLFSGKHVTSLGIQLGINGVSNKKDITLVGPEDWLQFTTADHQTYNVWQSNKLHIFTGRHIDKTNADVLAFISSYKEKYNQLPDEYVFKGYDQVMFIGLSLATFGPDFGKQITGKRFDVLDGSFDFKQEKVIENHFLEILQMINYQFVRKSF